MRSQESVARNCCIASKMTAKVGPRQTSGHYLLRNAAQRAGKGPRFWNRWLYVCMYVWESEPTRLHGIVPASMVQWCVLSFTNGSSIPQYLTDSSLERTASWKTHVRVNQSLLSKFVTPFWLRIPTSRCCERPCDGSNIRFMICFVVEQIDHLF